MTTLKRTSLLLIVSCACLGAVGCGGDDEGGRQIPAATAQALEAQLTNIQKRLDNGTPGACRDVLEGPRGPDRESVQTQLDSLPDDVDPDVRDALEQSFENLWSLVESRCQELEDEQPEQTETTEPESTPTETTETTETIPPPETETVPPDEQELPPEGDGDNGGAIPDGNGNGNGNGGGIGPGSFKQKKEKGE